jgi:hypothetical protein
MPFHELQQLASLPPHNQRGVDRSTPRACALAPTTHPPSPFSHLFVSGSLLNRKWMGCRVVYCPVAAMVASPCEPPRVSAGTSLSGCLPARHQPARSRSLAAGWPVCNLQLASEAVTRTARGTAPSRSCRVSVLLRPRARNRRGPSCLLAARPSPLRGLQLQVAIFSAGHWLHSPLHSSCGYLGASRGALLAEQRRARPPCAAPRRVVVSTSSSAQPEALVSLDARSRRVGLELGATRSARGTLRTAA